MACTEAYKEHIMYTFNGFCKTVMHYAVLNAWRDRNRRRQKKYPLNTSQKKSFIWLAVIVDGHIDRDTGDNIKQNLIAALFKFRFDEHPYLKTE